MSAPGLLKRCALRALGVSAKKERVDAFYYRI
jgi:hypothetical protein